MPAKTAGGTHRYPLTPMQLGLIYESVFVDRPWVNLEQIVVRFHDEPADLQAMTRAWQDLANRHDILRTVFHWDGDVPEQEVLPEADIHLDMVDLSDCDRDIAEARLQDWLATDRDLGVDLRTAPGWRLTWFFLDDARSVLVWTFHHAMLDGRSFTALLQEVLESYSDHGQNDPMPKSRKTGTSATFAEHCHAVAALDHNAAKRHFRTVLTGFDAVNRIEIEAVSDRLPAAQDQRPRPGRKQSVDQILPVSFGIGLQAKAQTTGTTVATLVLAAWGVVVARSSNREDAVFGVTRSGRHLVRGADRIAGCLINTTPLRVKIHRSRTIDELLASVRQQQLDVRPFEHTPLTDAARWSALPKGSTLFESAVMFERGSVDRILRERGGNWAKRRIEVHEEGALPLTMAVYQNEEMHFRLEHDPDRISRETAERLLSYTLNTLRAFCALSGDAPLARLDMLAHRESATVLALGRSDRPARSKPVMATCIATLFEAQAVQFPHRTAISCAGSPKNVTFADLDIRANRLAHLLRSKGAGTGSLVAICLPRSIDFVVAMLAIAKAGAAFLPVDPTYPQSLIAHMLSDAGASLAICDGSADLPIAETSVIYLHDNKELQLQISTAPDRRDLDPDRLAYVIYTSGTTGTPKGVAVSNRSLEGHIDAVCRTYELRPADLVLQFASLSFDVSIEEILPALTCGAELVLRDAQMAESMSAFLEKADALGLTVLNLPTAFWHILVDHMAATDTPLPSSVRLVIVGGEAIAPRALAQWQKLAPDVRWLNGYGPTEGTITATVYDPARCAPLAVNEDVPIGRPMGLTRAYILAPDGSLAPWGGKGELWIGGPSVALGYLNRPDLTADCFHADPFCPPPPGNADDATRRRMYRTGDVARWRPDGALAFAGRNDRQVKLNGYRIELRAIEKTLEDRADVGLALAAVDREGSEMARLLAWVTSAGNAQAPNPEQIQTDLRAQLPHFMVPTIQVIKSFPLTKSKKVDTRALPRPAARPKTVGIPDSGNDSVRQIQDIFGEVLGLADIGPDASFFDLGGHSLLAVRLIGRIETAFGRRLSIADLHAGPAPRLIADLLNAPQTGAKQRYLVPIQPLGARMPIYGVHVLGQNESFFRPLAQTLGTDQPVFGLSVGPLHTESPTGIAETAALYLEDIQQFQPEGPICLAAVSQGSFVAYELAQLLRDLGRDVAVLALFDAAGPGGRARLQGFARLHAHLKLLVRNGPKYLFTVTSNRVDGLRDLIERTKLRLAARLNYDPMSNPTTKKFVAANTLAIETYDARPYAGRLAIFRAKDSVFDAPEAVSSALGWRDVSVGGFDVIEVPGGHLTMLELPSVKTLAKQLSAVIDDASKPDATSRHDLGSE